MTTELDEMRSLLDDFLAETAEHLEASEARLLQLEVAPADASLARQLLRSFHTIKGNSAYFEFRAMSDLAHRLESLLTPVQNGEGPLDAEGMRMLFEGVDELKRLLTEVGGARQAAPGAAQPKVQSGESTDEIQEQRYLVLELNGMRMALLQAQVIEVTGAAPVTPLPHMPPYVAGLVNLRGVVVPLVDLQQRFWGTEGVRTAQHFVVVPWGRGRAAIAVDRVVGMEVLDAALARADTVGLFNQRIILQGGHPIALLDLDSTLRQDA